MPCHLKAFTKNCNGFVVHTFTSSTRVETEGAMQVKELPFVVGVMGDFSADGSDELEPLRDRKFKEVNRDNFDTMLKSMKPALNFSVQNELSGKPDEQLSVNLKFEKMEDFTPGRRCASGSRTQGAAAKTRRDH